MQGNQIRRLRRSVSRRATLASTTLLVGLLVPVGGLAQQVVAVDPARKAVPAKSPGDKPEEVVVTASRTGAKSLQKVPMAISVLDAKTMVRGGFTDLTEFSGTVPSLTIQQQGPGQNEIIIRGIADSTYNPTNVEDQSLVSVYLDDTPISLQGATPDLKVFDLERTEVIKGPQGTLYGAGAMAGTIRFISQKPDSERLYGYVESDDALTDGSGNGYSLRGMVNMPLVKDRLALRVNIYNDRQPGYIDNIGTHQQNANWDKNTQYRAALRFTPTERLKIDLSITHTDLYANGSTEAYSDLGVDTYDSITPEHYKDDLSIYNLTLNYNADWFAATSSTSFLNRRLGNDYSSEFLTQSLLTGYDSASPMLIQNKNQDFAQEIRFNSSGGGPFNWIGGFFYEQQRRSYNQDNPTPGLDNAIGISSVYYGAFQPNDVFSAKEQQNQHQEALFGEVSYSLGKLDLTAGVRYFNFSQNFNLYFGGVAGALGPGQPLTEQGSTSESGVNPRFVANYHLDRNMIVYAEAAKGFRYGGVNEPVPATFCGADLAAQGITTPSVTFGPDSLWSYSLGEKSTLAGGRLKLNVDAFYVDWSKIQTNDNLACGYYLTQNAGSVRSMGLELETSLRVLNNLTIGFNGAYNDSQTADTVANLNAPSGTQSPYSPRFTGAVIANYNLPLSKRTALDFQGDYEYRSDSTSSYQPDLTRTIPSSNILNIAMTYVTPQYELGLFGHNLNNNHTVTTINANTLIGYQPGDQVFYARPRTIGARLKVNF